MKASTDETPDVVVIGGGPGGSTAATLIAMSGHRVVLLERERFPRYQIGESLLPVTVHGVCSLLGVREKIEQAGFMHKNGGTFKWGKSPDMWTFAFGTNRYLKSYSAGYSYQVERSRFDAILLDNARKKGVDVREQHAATEVLIEDGRAVGVRYRDAEGNERDIRARFVIGAAGNSDTLYRHVGERVMSKFFQNVALFCYYEGAERLPPPNDGNILCVAFDQGWFWYIPLTDKLSSVGAVIAREHAPKLQQGHEQAMRYFIDQCPEIRDLLKNARRVTEGQYGHYRVRSDYSYCNTRFWMPGMMLVGDAACFIDPVFSSGVHLATYGGLLAARSINTVLEGELSEERCFAEFEERYRREYSVFYDFLLGFYDMHKDTDSYFWKARKVLRSEEQNNEAFVRLVAGGGTTSEEFFAMRDGIGQRFEAYKNKRMQGITPPLEDDAETLDIPHILDGMSREEGQIWDQAKDQRDAEAPLFGDGLVPSPDGLHWTPSPHQ